jgi:hypothetical protein
MAATFSGERNARAAGPGLVGAFNNEGSSRCGDTSSGLDIRNSSSNNNNNNNTNNNNKLLSPPPTPPTGVDDDFDMDDDAVKRGGGDFAAAAWMEIWDFVGGASFRAFVADNGSEKTLFTFFDAGVVGSCDLKSALVALIELAEGPLACSSVVLCVDRRIAPAEVQGLLRSLQWVGFEGMTLDHWAGDLDAVSARWLFVGMEL